MANKYVTLFSGDMMILIVNDITLNDSTTASEVNGSLSFTLKSRAIELRPDPVPFKDLQPGQIQLKLDEDIQTGEPNAYMTGSDSSSLVMNLLVRVEGEKRDLSDFLKLGEKIDGKE